MIVLDCKQGGSAWLKARLGIPTASSFDSILTPKTWKPSSQATGYLHRLLAEWITGVPGGVEVTGFMDRGTRLEPAARAWYSYERGVEVQEVGVVLRDDRMVGASPDGLVGKDGLLEIKCPSAAGHVSNLLHGLDGYECQVHGQLWLTDRQWCDRVSFNPDMPPVVVRYERDEAMIEALEEHVGAFVERLLKAREALLALGCQPAERLAIPASIVREDPF